MVVPVDVVSPIVKTITTFINVGVKLYQIHSDFESRMRSVIEWLKFLEPTIKRFEKFEEPTFIMMVEQLESNLRKGQTLIDGCTDVPALQLKKKHSLTKKLRDVIEDIQRLILLLYLHTKHSSEERRDGVDALTSFTCELPYPPRFPVGLQKPLEELKMQLVTEGESVLGLTGPGGFGKTTLALGFCEHVRDKFGSNIFFVRVSVLATYFNLNWKDPEKRRQSEDEMLDYISQKLHDCMLSRLANSSSSRIAPAMYRGLKTFLTQAGETPLLLVFDSITRRTEFLIDGFLGLSRVIKMTDFKILVTSRYNISKFPSYYMKSLNKIDAKTLFSSLLSIGESTGEKRHPVPDHLKMEVLELCNGLPQAIEGVALLLRDKSIEVWTTKRDKMRGGSVLDFVGDLLHRLQSSVDEFESDHLDKKQSKLVQQCFMDLCVFLKDQPIPVAALIDIWTELHELKYKDDESIENLHLLTEWSFANLLFPRRDTEVHTYDSYYSQHFVSQHDILRDLAIHQSNLGTESRHRLIIDVPKESFPDWWEKSVYEKPVPARLVSISTDRYFPKEVDKMNLPKAEVLVLHFKAETFGLPNFLNTMSKSLKVLIVTNHGQLHAKVSEFRLLGSLSGLKRIRLEGISISSMKKNSMKVESLLKISFFMCDFDQASSKSPIKISKAFPNLVEINIDYCNNLKELPAELCGLKKLKKLSITHCDKLHALPEDIRNLVQLEVLRLLACIKLLQLPGSISELAQLKLINISDCWSITEWPDIGRMQSLRTLIVIHCPGLRMLPQSFSGWLPEIKVICDEETRQPWGDLPAAIKTKIKVIESN